MSETAQENGSIEEKFTLKKKFSNKQKIARRRWFERGEYNKTPVLDTKQIVSYAHCIDDFLNQIFLAMEDGYMYYSFDPRYVACQVGPLISCTVVKLEYQDPPEPKKSTPEVAEIQEKFADQQGAAAKEFAEPVKAKRGPKPRSAA